MSKYRVIDTTMHNRHWIVGQIREIDLDARRGRVRLSSGECESVEFSASQLKKAKQIFIEGDVAEFGGMRDFYLPGMPCSLFVDTIKRVDGK